MSWNGVLWVLQIYEDFLRFPTEMTPGGEFETKILSFFLSAKGTRFSPEPGGIELIYVNNKKLNPGIQSTKIITFP
jgi:hypothetical protein